MRLGLRGAWSGVGVLIGLFRCLATRGGYWGLCTPLITCRRHSQTVTTFNKREVGIGRIGIEENSILFLLLGTCVSFAFVSFLGTRVSSVFVVHYILNYLFARYGPQFVEENFALHTGRGATTMRAYSVVYRCAYRIVQQRSLEGSGVVGAMRLGLRGVWSGVGVLIGLFRCLATRGGVWGLRTPFITRRPQSQTDTTLKQREGGLGRIGIEGILIYVSFLGTRVSFSFLGTRVSFGASVAGNMQAYIGASRGKGAAGDASANFVIS
jgi:hypothetical protein